MSLIVIGRTEFQVDGRIRINTLKMAQNSKEPSTAGIKHVRRKSGRNELSQVGSDQNTEDFVSVQVSQKQNIKQEFV